MTAIVDSNRGEGLGWRLICRFAALLCGPLAVWAAYDSAVAYWMTQPPESAPSALRHRPALRWTALEGHLIEPAWLATNQAQVKTTAVAVLRDSPLSSSALRALGQIEALQSPTGGAAQFRSAEQVTRRDGLNQLQLIGIAQQAGDFTDGLRHYNRLLLSAPAAENALFPTLAKAITFDEVRGPLAAYAPQPWFASFLSLAIERGADPVAVIDLYARSARALPEAAKQTVGLRLVSQLLTSGHLADARAMAATIPGIGAKLRDEFAMTTTTTSPALAPLSWKLGNDEAIETALTPPGQLAVRVASGRPSVVAERLMLAEPGRYMLSHDVRYDSSDPPAGLTWTVNCTNGTRIAKMAVPQAPGNLRFSVLIEIPTGCGGQSWQLTATPADAQSASSVTIEKLGFVPQ